MTLEEAKNYIKTTILRREKKRSVASHVMPIALIGPITDEDLDRLVVELLAEGYVVVEQGRQRGFPGTGHIRIDWSNKTHAS